MADIKIFTDDIEESAVEQINTLVNSPVFKDSKIRIMPDVHAGAGCVIGFTADFGGKIVPNLVGVDISCGMNVTNYGKCAVSDEFLKDVDDFIKNNIPAGKNVNDYESDYVKSLVERLYCKNELHDVEHIYKSLSTLGGGNHFIELDHDKEGNMYLVIHSGSRNLGKQVCDIYQKKAEKNFSNVNLTKEDKERIISECKKAGKENEIQHKLEEEKSKKRNATIVPPEGLEYLVGKEAEDYLHDMAICTEFAIASRTGMSNKITDFMFKEYAPEQRIIESFETMHNYIDISTRMIRKGAIDASLGKKMIIPMNMRDGSIIAEGLGNKDWNCSAPHVAGRTMSRKQAKLNINIDDFKKSMEGIYTTTANQETIDESPFAYKPADEIVNKIKETVVIKRVLKPIYNFKAED